MGRYSTLCVCHKYGSKTGSRWGAWFQHIRGTLPNSCSRQVDEERTASPLTLVSLAFLMGKQMAGPLERLGNHPCQYVPAMA